MTGITAQIRLVKQSLQNRQAGLAIALSVTSSGLAPSSEPQQSLRGDCRRGTVDRFNVVGRIGRPAIKVAEITEPRCSSIPIGDAVEGGVGNIEFAGGFSRAPLPPPCEGRGR